jgi:hypothetical protein
LARTLLRLSLLVLLGTSTVWAQRNPEWEIFGGYSFERADVREYYKLTPIIYTFRDQYVNLNGWEAAVTENVNHWFGGTLNFTGHYKNPVVNGTKNNINRFSVLYGPRFFYRMKWATPYAHVLLGAGRTSVTVSPGPHAEEWGFATAFGGGLDLHLGKHAAARVFQVQYTPLNQVGTGNNNFQASAGIVFYAGKK